MNTIHNSQLSLAVLQNDLSWENRKANLEAFETQISSLKGTVDLIILPETFSTGFTMNVEEFADSDGSILEWMKDQANLAVSAITGSAIVKEKGSYFNRLYWVDARGNHSQYDKRHLFRMGGERDHFTEGRDRVVIRIKEFRILLQICYDLRFPVFVRNQDDYDAIIYVANWPSSRAHVWDILLQARAIENQCFVIGANRCGTDGLGVSNCGSSMVIDPRGNIKNRLEDQPAILSASLDINELLNFRKKFPVLEDRDSFELLL